VSSDRTPAKKLVSREGAKKIGAVSPISRLLKAQERDNQSGEAERRQHPPPDFPNYAETSPNAEVAIPRFHRPAPLQRTIRQGQFA
jgi:hypothetical protein